MKGGWSAEKECVEGRRTMAMVSTPSTVKIKIKKQSRWKSKSKSRWSPKSGVKGWKRRRHWEASIGGGGSLPHRHRWSSTAMGRSSSAKMVGWLHKAFTNPSPSIWRPINSRRREASTRCSGGSTSIGCSMMSTVVVFDEWQWWTDGHGEDMGSGKKLRNDGHKLIFGIFFLFLIKKFIHPWGMETLIPTGEGGFRFLGLGRDLKSLELSLIHIWRCRRRG